MYDLSSGEITQNKDGVNLGAYDLTVQGLTIGLGNNNKPTNTALGVSALTSNTSGTGNTAVGSTALSSNGVGSNNTAVGENALNSLISGGENTAVGGAALSATGIKSGNTAVGNLSLSSNQTGNYNTAIGESAGDDCSNNSYCTFIGHNSNDPSHNDHTIVLGNSATAFLKCRVGLTVTSDERDKKEIKPLSYGLNYITEINPVEFKWNMRDGGIIDIPEIGFTAQNLKKGQENLNIDIPRLVIDNNPDKLEITPCCLMPILVKSIQELSQQLNETNKKLEETNKKLEELTLKVNSL